MKCYLPSQSDERPCFVMCNVGSCLMFCCGKAHGAALIRFAQLIMVIFCLFSTPSFAVTYEGVVGSTSYAPGGYITSASIAVSKNVAAGNSIIVTFVVATLGDTSTPTCSDSSGYIYSLDASENSNTSYQTFICSAHAVLPLSTTDTITINFGANAIAVAATAYEFSGLAASPIDQSASSFGSGTAPSSGSTPNTTQANELLIGAISTYGNNGGFTEGSGYIYLGSESVSAWWVNTISTEYKTVSATGNYVADGTLGSSVNWAAAIATYKSSVSATTINLSGTLYSDEGTTPLSGQTVRLLVEGASAGTAVTDASGNYAITATVAAGDGYVPLLVYVDDGSVVGTSVTVMDSTSSTAISDLHIYADHLIVRNDYGFAPLDIGDMSGAMAPYVDGDILFSISWPDITVTGANTELYIPAGHSFTPGGNVTVPHVKILGTLTAGSNTFTVSGDWDHTYGTFNQGTSMVDFTGTGTVQIAGAWWTKPFYNVNAAAAGQTTTIAYGNGIDVANVLTLGSGTLAGGSVNLSLNSGTPLVSTGTTITNTQIKFHPNSGGPINVAAAAYRDVWLAGNAATNSFNLMGDMSCATLRVYGSGPGDHSIFDTGGFAINCTNLAIGSYVDTDRYGTLRLNNSLVDVSGSVTIYASDNNGTNQIDAGSATINVGGNWTSSDTFAYGTSSVNFTGNGTITVGDSSNWWAKPFYNVSAAFAGKTTTIAAGQGIAVENNLVLENGTLVGGDVVLSKSSGTPLTTSAFLNNSAFMYSTQTSGTVYIAPANYPNLRIAGWTSGATNSFQLAGDISCNTLAVAGTDAGSLTIMDTSANNYSISCNSLEVGASWNAAIYNKLVLNNSTVDINGALSISSSDGGGANEIDAGSATINVSGNWTNNDTFTAGTSTVILDGTGQALNGSTTFYNLTKTVTGADTLSFAAGSTQTITGTATLNGVSGQLLSLRSTASPTQWNFNLATGAAKAISYVDVQDSDASGSDSSLLDINPSYSVDSGNNVSWFGNANITVVKSSTVISDPVNGTTNPKRIPGAVIEYSILVTNTAGVQATDLTITDDLSAETTTLNFEVDSYGIARGIQVTAPNINGGVALNLTNASDGDQGDYGATAVNTVTVGGIILNVGEQAMVKFRVTIQ